MVCKNWRKETENKGSDKDCFIKGHVRQIGNFPSIQAKRAADLAEKRELMALDAAIRKKADDEFDHKLKYFKLHRGALIKQYREEREEDARERLNIKKRARQLIQLGHTYLMLRLIFGKFEERKKFLAGEALKNFSAARIQNMFRKYKKRISTNLETNMVNFNFKEIETQKYAAAKKKGINPA